VSIQFYYWSLYKILDRFRSFQVVASTISVSESASSTRSSFRLSFLSIIVASSPEMLPSSNPSEGRGGRSGHGGREVRGGHENPDTILLNNLSFPKPPFSENSNRSPPTSTADDTSMDIEAPPLAFGDAPSTDQGTLVPTVQPTTTVEDEDISDDETVTTRGSNGPRNAHSRDHPAARELTLKFLFQSSQELSPREVAGPCLQLIHAIAKIKTTLPNIVLDQHGNTITNFSHDVLSKFNQYLVLSKFNQYLPTASTPAKSTPKKVINHWTLLKVRIKMSLSEIRQHELVARVLETTRGRLNLHPWGAKIRDVVSVGFIVGALPKYQMSENFTSHVQKVLADKLHIPARKVHVKCTMTRASTVHKRSPHPTCNFNARM
jgi:hypothetical protein